MSICTPSVRQLARPLARPLAGYGDFAYDRDALAYFDDVGVTSALARRKIANLIRVLKANAPWEDVRAYVFYKGMQRTDGDIITIGGWSPNVAASTVGSPVLTNSGINLNGSSQYVVDDSDVWDGGTELTVLADFIQADTSGNRGIVSIWNNASVSWRLRAAGGTTNYRWDSSSSDSVYWGSPSGTSLTTIGFTYSGSSVTFFKNGVIETSAGDVASSLADSVAPIRIGCVTTTGDVITNFFSGIIGCVIVIKAALNASQVQAINAAMEALRYDYDADAEAFFSAAGIGNGIQRDAINELVVDIKAASLWPKFSALYPFVGGTASSHSYNLINPSTYQITWNGTVTHNANGITGDGTTGYGDTGYNASASGASLSSFALSIYSRGPTPANGTSRFDVGSSDNATNFTFLGWGESGSIEAGSVGNGSFSSQLAPSTGTGNILHTGLCTVATNGSRAQQYYNNGTPIGSPVTATGAFSNRNLYVLANNQNGTASVFSLKNLALASIGQGRSAAEESSFGSIVQKFQTALGRAV